MSNINHTHNERLPFDVLGHVFAFYLKEESVNYPIETLLLVCKTWNYAAIGHPSLWATYSIGLETVYETKPWLHRLPLRLKRTGSMTPLHINIYTIEPQVARGTDEAWYREWKVSARLYQIRILPRILDILAGENGKFCLRWKSLRISVGIDYMKFGRGKYGKHQLAALTYPMPLLDELSLSALYLYSTGIRLFPKLPSLRSVYLDEVSFDLAPDLSHAKRAFLKDVEWTNKSSRSLLEHSPQLHSLFLKDEVSSGLHPQVYPALRALFLGDTQISEKLRTAEMPQLESLLVGFLGDHLEEVMELSAISQIRHLSLISTRPLGGKSLEALAVIGKCTKLQVLIVNRHMLSSLPDEWENAVNVAHPTSQGKNIHLILEDEDPFDVLTRITFK